MLASRWLTAQLTQDADGLYHSTLSLVDGPPRVHWDDIDPIARARALRELVDVCNGRVRLLLVAQNGSVLQ